tara:strand:+ start:3244 stop:3582 length:339 start_codon:yes stop_codon:yes gene_type:complete
MKQVILVRTDLKMDKSKLAVQVAHASVEAVLQSDPKDVEEWRMEGMKKVILKVPSLPEMVKHHKHAKKDKLVSVLITDAGKTFFKKATRTCVGIGPAEEADLDRVTGHLKMF